MTATSSPTVSTVTPEELELVREGVRELADRSVAPRAAEIDRTGEFPGDIVSLFREKDIFALAFPGEYGGVGGSCSTLVVAIEELARVCATSSLLLAVQALGSFPIILGGSDEQKQRFLPPLASGERLAAYALSEPGAGSDPAGMTTRAQRDGDEYIIHGSKLWITNGGVADTIVLFAKTDMEAGARGVSAFVLERERLTGFTATPIHGKLGIRGSNTAELSFDGTRVPVANRLGDEGSGFGLAMRVLDHSRPGIAGQALGIAQGALDYAVRYASEREQFGKPIAAFQGVQFMLADMAAGVAAARALLYAACEKVDTHAADMTRFAAMAKLFASDTAMRVTTDAVQVLGGYGYVNEYPVERMMRDAKITQIYEGTNQIQRLVIARELARGH